MCYILYVQSTLLQHAGFYDLDDMSSFPSLSNFDKLHDRKQQLSIMWVYWKQEVKLRLRKSNEDDFSDILDEDENPFDEENEDDDVNFISSKSLVKTLKPWQRFAAYIPSICLYIFFFSLFFSFSGDVTFFGIGMLVVIPVLMLLYRILLGVRLKHSGLLDPRVSDLLWFSILSGSLNKMSAEYVTTNITYDDFIKVILMKAKHKLSKPCIIMCFKLLKKMLKTHSSDEVVDIVAILALYKGAMNELTNKLKQVHRKNERATQFIIRAIKNVQILMDKTKSYILDDQDGFVFKKVYRPSSDILSINCGNVPLKLYEKNSRKIG